MNGKEFKELTEKDIDVLLDNVVIVSKDNIADMLKSGGISSIRLSNNYRASLTLDSVGEGCQFFHLSISNASESTDIDVATDMADDILGNNVRSVGVVTNPNIFHFIKEIDKDILEKVDRDMLDKVCRGILKKE